MAEAAAGSAEKTVAERVAGSAAAMVVAGSVANSTGVAAVSLSSWPTQKAKVAAGSAAATVAAGCAAVAATVESAAAKAVGAKAVEAGWVAVGLVVAGWVAGWCMSASSSGTCSRYTSPRSHLVGWCLLSNIRRIVCQNIHRLK